MIQLIQFRQQTIASIGVGILLLCISPFLNPPTFEDPTGQIQCSIDPFAYITCTQLGVPVQINCNNYIWCQKKEQVYFGLNIVYIEILMALVMAFLFWAEPTCLDSGPGCCNRWYKFKPFTLFFMAFGLLYLASVAIDLNSYYITNYVLYPLFLYVAGFAFLYSTLLFCTQYSIEEYAIEEYSSIK